MTIKSFSFLNPTSPVEQEKNWRQFDENSKFGLFTPTVADINNFGSAKAWYQLYGPVVFYWIKLTSDGVDMTAGAAPKISNLPYGPQSASGGKTLSEYQVSLTARGGAGGASVPLIATADAWATAVGGTSYIYLPAGPWTAPAIQNIWVQGWIFRDA